METSIPRSIYVSIYRSIDRAIDGSMDRGTTLPRRKDVSLPSLEIIGGVSAAVESTKVPGLFQNLIAH